MHSDRELVAAVARGDMDALKELFLRHHEDVLNVVYPMVGKKGLAEDIVQEAFLALLEHAADYKGGGSFKSWLYRIAVNLALMELRRDRRRQPTDTFDGLPAEGEAPDETAERSDLQTLVLNALLQLPEDQRAAVTLRKIKGLGVDECARVLECDEGTVKSRVFYGLQRMRQILVSLGVGDESR